jgi:hypothetical protein
MPLSQIPTNARPCRWSELIADAEPAICVATKPLRMRSKIWLFWSWLVFWTARQSAVVEVVRDRVALRELVVGLRRGP